MKYVFFKYEVFSPQSHQAAMASCAEDGQNTPLKFPEKCEIPRSDLQPLPTTHLY